MAARRTTPNGIASYSAGGIAKGPFPARITSMQVTVGLHRFNRTTGNERTGRLKLLSYTLTPKDIPE